MARHCIRCCADIWSLGVVLYEMMVLKPPFTASDVSSLMKKIRTGVYEPLPKYVCVHLLVPEPHLSACPSAPKPVPLIWTPNPTLCPAPPAAAAPSEVYTPIPSPNHKPDPEQTCHSPSGRRKVPQGDSSVF